MLNVPWREVPQQTVSAGFGFVEAPSFDRNGVLYFSEVRAGLVHRLDADRTGAQPEVFHSVESGWCNGTAIHRDGRLFLCDVGAGCIWTLTPEGTATVFSTSPIHEGLHWRSE